LQVRRADATDDHANAVQRGIGHVVGEDRQYRHAADRVGAHPHHAAPAQVLSAR
jgi:hypothetical protein